MLLIKLTFFVNHITCQIKPGAFFVVEEIILANNTQTCLNRGMTQAIRPMNPADVLLIKSLSKRVLLLMPLRWLTFLR